MTEPTYAELIAAWKIEAEKNLNRSNDIRVGYARAVLAKWGAPQPTQAQAGAVPLTREQVKAICVEAGYETATLQERADFINGIRHAERHHRITQKGV